MSGVRVIHGDCLDVLAGLEAESVDAVVTDPPAGISFMGKEWDHHKGGRAQWCAWMEQVAAECLRVIKPGGHALVWALPRTSHWTATAWEDAGWEVRDRLAHLFGSGFPKSLDVSKAIDRMRDDGRDVRAVCEWLARARDSVGATNEQMDRACGLASGGGKSAGHWTAGPTYVQPRVPPWDCWLALKALLGFGDEMDAEVWRLNGRKGKPGDAWDQREVVGERRKLQSYGANNVYGDGPDKGGVQILTAPATDAAKAWAGWGTALKPAVEDWWLFRRPLSEGSIAANVLRHGTGALAIDQCRVAAGAGDYDHPGDLTKRPMARHSFEAVEQGALKVTQAPPHNAGRWPPNLLHSGDPEVLAAFEAFGERTSGGQHSSRSGALNNTHHERSAIELHNFHPGDRGTAARFFPSLGYEPGELRFHYSGKANKQDRAGSQHPTIKPQSLLRWLARLICPPGGVILDPFAGSGSLGTAALAEGFSAILIEKEEEHYRDCLARLEAWRAMPPAKAKAPRRPSRPKVRVVPPSAPVQLSLLEPAA